MALGHASDYTAVIHMQGGQRIWTDVEGVSKLSWGRKLDDYSEAEVTVAKRSASDACCGKLGDTHTWGHELSIYRDDEFVWQGPITAKRETRELFTFEARDMIGWFDRRVTLGVYNWADKTTQNTNPAKPIDSALILGKIITDAFGRTNGFWTNPLLDPNLLAHVNIPAHSGHSATLQCLRLGDTNLGKAVRSVSENGLDLYTVGRTINAIPTSWAHEWPPIRLTENDFLADLEVRETGLDAATVAWVVGTQPQVPMSGNTQPPSETPAPLAPWPYLADGRWVPYEPADPFFGVIMQSGSSMTATGVWECRNLAQAGVAYGNPPPVDVIVPPNAQLSPTAAVAMRELVPGYPVMVSLESYCTKARNRFVLNEVEVKVDLASESMAESVQISLAAQGNPLSPTPPPA